MQYDSFTLSLPPLLFIYFSMSVYMCGCIYILFLFCFLKIYNEDVLLLILYLDFVLHYSGNDLGPLLQLLIDQPNIPSEEGMQELF